MQIRNANTIYAKTCIWRRNCKLEMPWIVAWPCLGIEELIPSIEFLTSFEWLDAGRPFVPRACTIVGCQHLMTTLLFGRQLYFIYFYTNLVVIFCFLKTNLRCVDIFFEVKWSSCFVVKLILYSYSKHWVPNTRLSVHKLMHNEKLINFAHQQ